MTTSQPSIFSAGEGLAFTVTKTPAKQEGTSNPWRLWVFVDAMWAERRGFGECILYTPGIVGGTGTGYSSSLAAAEALKQIHPGTASRSSMVSLGTTEITTEGIVDLNLTSPPPTNTSSLQWSCSNLPAPGVDRRQPSSSGVSDCAAAIVVAHRDASNFRSALLLLLGTILAFALQVAYDGLPLRRAST
jgi:hypothetical protein